MNIVNLMYCFPPMLAWTSRNCGVKFMKLTGHGIF